MSPEQNRALVRRWYDDVLNDRNFAAVDEIVAPDFVINGQPVGSEGIRQAAVWVRSVFPDLRVTVEDVVAERDRVVTRFTARATHCGEFLGVPATGKAVTMSGVHVDRVAHGRIAERWETVDLLGLLQQLGATIQPPRPPG
ncbi:MAG TPA: ester cyclase [Chloroflexota bacterium]|nr:ester cyclase [Chloroflexota bacterium]